MKKILKLSLFGIVILVGMIMSTKALTVWNFEDWQAGTNYGSKTKISSNITNLKGEQEENGGMKVGPYNKASKAKLSDGIVEEVYVGLDLNNYQNSELFELSIALNQQTEGISKYLTEAVVMTQKSGNKFVLTANWAKEKSPIATIDKSGVYTYKWEFKKEDNKIKVKFTILDYENVLGTTDFVELKVEDVTKASDVRYLWACNIKASYGIDIYTKLPERQFSKIENPETADINLGLLIILMIVGILSFYYVKKRFK